MLKGGYNTWINPREWNKSHCNPYNNQNYPNCELVYTLPVPETPYISYIKGVLDLNPFVNIEELRTPVDGFNFSIEEYTKFEDDLINTEKFETYNYQNYVPYGIFKKDYYYIVSCVARNKSGISDVSNRYPVDLLGPIEDYVPPPSQRIACGGILVCDVLIICEASEPIQEIICGSTVICGVPILCEEKSSPPYNGPTVQKIFCNGVLLCDIPILCN